MPICPECHSGDPRATPLLNPRDCLLQHTQYICGTCGRCICIERDPKRGLMRWNFPFRTLDIAKLYLRAAEETLQAGCEIYEITGKNGRASYKIFENKAELLQFLMKNREKTCKSGRPVFVTPAYHKFENTQVRRLTPEEAERYLAERQP